MQSTSDPEVHDCFVSSSFKRSASVPARPPRSCDGTVSVAGDRGGVGGDPDRCPDRRRASSPNDDRRRSSSSRDGRSVSRADSDGDADGTMSDVGGDGDAAREICGEVSGSDT